MPVLSCIYCIFTTDIFLMPGKSSVAQSSRIDCTLKLKIIADFESAEQVVSIRHEHGILLQHLEQLQLMNKK